MEQLPEHQARYELTFRHPNGDDTWTREWARDYHEALIKALLFCPVNCRVVRIERLPD